MTSQQQESFIEAMILAKIDRERQRRGPFKIDGVTLEQAESIVTLAIGHLYDRLYGVPFAKEVRSNARTVAIDTVRHHFQNAERLDIEDRLALRLGDLGE